MIIPFNELVAIPGSHSRDYSNQHCYYNTSDDNNTWPINENTHFPTMQEIFKAIATESGAPKTIDTFSVFYKIVNADNAMLSLPKNSIKVNINPEPYYNELTNDHDIFESFAYFENIEDAYEYSINNPKITE